MTAASEGGAESAGLLRDAKAGDRAAFERVVLGHERRVLLTALRLLGRWEDAQDAAQEVFVRLQRYLGRFDEALDLAPWLYRMTVNVCRDIGRKRTAHDDLDPNAADPAWARSAPRVRRKSAASWRPRCEGSLKRSARPWCCAISKACRRAKWRASSGRPRLPCAPK